MLTFRFQKQGEKKIGGEGENEEYIQNETKNKHTHDAEDVYANTHPMTTRAAARRRFQDAQLSYPKRKYRNGQQ